MAFLHGATINHMKTLWSLVGSLRGKGFVESTRLIDFCLNRQAKKWGLLWSWFVNVDLDVDVDVAVKGIFVFGDILGLASN